jgi:hypothetical protein
MKKYLVLPVILVVFTCTMALAQTSDAEADAIVNLLGVQKKEAMRQLVAVTKKDSVAFWKIYDEYQAQNKKEAKNRIQLYERTAMAYSNMSPAVADSLAMKYFANRMDQEKALEVYYKKVKTSTNAILAFQFYQAEIYMLTQIRTQIMHQIPAYGELVMAARQKK